MKNNSDSTIILLAEDDDGHAELICEYLKDTGLPNPIYRFKHGAEVWDFLHNKNSTLKFEMWHQMGPGSEGRVAYPSQGD